MKALYKKHHQTDSGQSLVEVAIFLPVIIILLLGVVEVSNLLVTQNRVSAASRAATGFAATNIVGDEWKDVDTWSSSMVDVARNNVTETLELDENRWDIWTIKAKVNGDASGFDEWTAVHAFGFNTVMSEAEWQAADIQGDVFAALQESGTPAQDLEVAATVAYHDRKSILGLDAFNLGPVTRIRGLNVMRVDPEPAYLSCDIFPISIYFNNISLYPTNFDGTLAANEETYDPSDWDPGNPGAYSDDPYDHSGFDLAVGGHPLINATRGDIFEAREQNSPNTIGAFGWLTWDGSTSGDDLARSMTYPGNLSLHLPPPANKVNYDNPHDPFVNSNDHKKKDLVLNTNDWIQGYTGNTNKVQGILEELAKSRKPIQIVVYDETEGTGAGYNYKIAGFVVVKVVGYRTTKSDKRILIEFVRWGNDCTAPEDNS